MSCSITVTLLVSEHVGWSELREVLESMAEVRVIHESHTMEELQRTVITYQPNVIIADALIDHRPTASQLDDLRLHHSPSTKIILLGSYYIHNSTGSPVDTGIVGYLLWNNLSSRTLRLALALLCTSDMRIVSETAAKQYVTALCGVSDTSVPYLTQNELITLQRLAEGRTHETIARDLRVSRRTVERIVAELEQKFDAQNKFVLAVKAAHFGLIS